MILSVNARFSPIVASVVSVSLLASCASGPGGRADQTVAVANASTVLAGGWEHPGETGVKARPQGARGAHDLVAIEPPAEGKIETADIAGPGQRSAMSGAPAHKSVGAGTTSEIIVRSRIK